MKKKIPLLLYMCCSFFILNAQNTAARFEQLNADFLTPGSSKVLVAAHRGAHLEAPENSLKGFQHTIDMGIDIIELDVRCTRDGQLVVIHDKTVDRTTNGKGAVDSFTFEEIRKLRLMFNGKSTDQQIPALKEALLLAKGKILVDLDIKTASCIDKIIREVKETGTENTCFFFVDEAQHVPMLKQQDSTFRVLFRTNSEEEAREALSSIKPEAVHIDPSHHTEEMVAFIKQHGARVWINALGDVDRKAAAGNPAAFEEVLSKGVNIIQTDQPGLLKRYLESTNRH